MVQKFSYNHSIIGRGYHAYFLGIIRVVEIEMLLIGIRTMRRKGNLLDYKDGSI